MDEAPLALVVGAVEAAPRGANVSAAQVCKHVGVWARAMLSPRKEWYGL